MGVIIDVNRPSHIIEVPQYRSKIIEVNRSGNNGLSAYQIAVANGFVGTEQEWLASLDGDAANRYTHHQITPASVWTINHNLGRYPSIQLLSVGGVEFFGTITNTSINQAIVNLTVSVAGIAQCN